MRRILLPRFTTLPLFSFRDKDKRNSQRQLPPARRAACSPVEPRGRAGWFIRRASCYRAIIPIKLTACRRAGLLFSRDAAISASARCLNRTGGFSAVAEIRGSSSACARCVIRRVRWNIYRARIVECINLASSFQRKSASYT